MTTVLAFYMWPPFWITETGSSETTRDPSQADDEVGRFALATGIVASVRRDGLFVFDFAGRPDCVRPGPQPDTAKADTTFDQSLSAMRMCMTILNAYLACFFTAQHQCALSDLTTTDMYMKMRLGPDDLLALPDLTAPIHDFGGPHGSTLRHAGAYARTMIDQGGGPVDWENFSQHGQRDDLPVFVVEDSMRRLDAILPNADALIAANLLLQATRAAEEIDFPTALVTAWAVVEKAVVTLWQRHLESRRPDLVGADAVPVVGAARRRILEGRDYTASIIIETLSLLGEISNDLYEHLTAARRARNGWLHSLAPVDANDVTHAMAAAETLVNRIHGVELTMVWGYGSGPY